MAMSSQEYLDKMKLRQSYPNLWHTDLMGTIQADLPCNVPPFAVWRPVADHASHICSAEELFTMTCQGMSAVEVTYRAVGSVEKVDARSYAFSLRLYAALALLLPQLASCFKMSSTYRRLSVATIFILQQLACVFSIVAMIIGSQEIRETAQILSLMSDCVYWTVCACMQTQHKIEMDKRDSQLPPTEMVVPALQQMSRSH